MKSFTEEEISAYEKETNTKRSYFSAKFQIQKNQELILNSYNNGMSCRLIWQLLKRRNEFTRNYTSFMKAFNELYNKTPEQVPTQITISEKNQEQAKKENINTENTQVLSIKKKTFNFNSLANKDDLI